VNTEICVKIGHFILETIELNKFLFQKVKFLKNRKSVYFTLQNYNKLAFEICQKQSIHIEIVKPS
jgi:hypothetical protein